MRYEWLETLDESGKSIIERALTCGNEAVMALSLAIVDGEALEEDNVPAIVAAAREQNIEKVKQLIEDNADLDEADGLGLTALHWAAIAGNRDLVNLLINRGANLNVSCPTNFNVTPLFLAQWLGHEDIVHILKEHNALV